jgi:PAS domain S-box-containing protein
MHTRQSDQPFLDALPDAVIIVQEDGRILRVNAQSEAVFRCRKQDLLGKPVEILLPEHVRRAHGSHRGRYLAEPRRRPMGSGIPLVARRLDGTEFPVDVSLSSVQGQRGRLVIAAIRDLTERTRLMELVRESEAKYRLVVENASEVFYRVRLGPDPARGGVEFVSPQCEQVTGHSPEEFLHNPNLWIESIHPADRAAVFAGTEAILTTRVAATRYYRIASGAVGEYRWIADRVVPLVDRGGTVTGYQGVARDITERVRESDERLRLESQLQQVQKMEAMGRLAAGVAHDFNNLLTIIMGCLDLERVELGPEGYTRAHLTEIEGTAHRAADLTRQLLAFSKQQVIAPRVLDLNAQVRGLQSLLERALGEGVALTIALGVDLWSIRVDPSQVDQLVINLAINGRDAMPDGGRLSIETSNVVIDQACSEAHAGCRPGDYVLLAVADAGRGMDPVTLAHAFEPFFTTKPEGKGTGLGLATVDAIVKQNDGFLSIQSEPGHGTGIKLYLPRYQGHERPAAVISEPFPVGGHETVLLVEDNAQLRHLTSRLLTQLGYVVLEAGAPSAALGLCREFRGEIHLLQTDVVMPSMSGLQLAESVTALRPAIRTLYMSGYAETIIAQRGRLPQGVRFLPKPFGINALAKEVRGALGCEP